MFFYFLPTQYTTPIFSEMQVFFANFVEIKEKTCGQAVGIGAIKHMTDRMYQVDTIKIMLNRFKGLKFFLILWEVFDIIIGSRNLRSY